MGWTENEDSECSEEVIVEEEELEDEGAELWEEWEREDWELVDSEEDEEDGNVFLVTDSIATSSFFFLDLADVKSISLISLY